MNGVSSTLAAAAVVAAAHKSSDTTEEFNRMQKELESAENENMELKAKLAVAASVPAAAVTSKVLHENFTQSEGSSVDNDEIERLKDELESAKCELSDLRTQTLSTSSSGGSLTKSDAAPSSLEIEMLKSALEASNKQNVDDKQSYKKALADANKEISILQSKVDSSPQTLDGTFAPSEITSTDPMVSVVNGKLRRRELELDTMRKMLDEAYAEAKNERNAALQVGKVTQAVMEEMDSMREESNKLVRLLVRERKRSRKFREMFENAGLSADADVDDDSSVSSAWLWNSSASLSGDKEASSKIAKRNWGLTLKLTKAQAEK
mmetsp:Transcript_785/g.1095  ORF Transcript_785/g.1095 Transcript_785/m.1095 type:complete len:321 (-) Transcript_785:225-1187(-)